MAAIKSVQDDAVMNVPCKLFYLFQEFVGSFPLFGVYVRPAVCANCIQGLLQQHAREY